MPDQRSPGPSAWAADTPLGAGHLSPTHTPPRPGDQPGGDRGSPVLNALHWVVSSPTMPGARLSAGRVGPPAVGCHGTSLFKFWEAAPHRHCVHD